MNVKERLKRPHPPWLQHVVLVLVIGLCLFGCDVNVHNVGSLEQPEVGQDTLATESGEPDDAAVPDVDQDRDGIFRWQK